MPSPNDIPVWWPASITPAPPSGVVVASVNYNTRPMIARLLWSLYRFLGDELRSVVVVDNGSADGSVELLQAAAEAGLCELILNPQNGHHGPGLSQAVSHLAQAAQSQTGPRPWLWLLDSDCVVARPDAATAAVAAAVEQNAALVGEAFWNQWNNRNQFAGFSLLLDPAQVWRAEVGAIPDGGDPIGDFEQACVENGVPRFSFPFTRAGYLIHRGRSTLAAVRQRAEVENPLYEWAQTHHEAHFQEAPNAKARYVELTQEFEQQVPELTADALIQACGRG